MEGHRSYSDPGYPDQNYSDHGYSDAGYSEGAGWQGDRGYGGGEGRYSAPPDYTASEARQPEPTRPMSDAGRGGVVGPRSGLPIPEEPSRRPAASPRSPGPAGETYRSKRPAAAALFGVIAGVLEIPALLLLRDAMFGTDPSGVAAGVCLVAALPLLAVGLYAVATGAVRAAGPNSAQAWLRPPVAYLSVGLVLIIAAGLAA